MSARAFKNPFARCQGCNTALESCAVLDSVLDRTNTPEQVHTNTAVDGCRLKPTLPAKHMYWLRCLGVPALCQGQLAAHKAI